MKEKIRRFMIGRYGVDPLAQFMMKAVLFILIVSIFLRNGILDVIAIGMIIWTYFRIFSKNHQKRYAENQAYLMQAGKVKSLFMKQKRLMQERKVYHIYTCPDCKQKIRVPKGKGKISITCPKCHKEFIKKS